MLLSIYFVSMRKKSTGFSIIDFKLSKPLNKAASTISKDNVQLLLF